jgi:hypothetical protein
VLAVDSAKNAVDAKGRLVGGLLSKSLSAHKNAAQLLVQIVNAVNSLHIAGFNLAAGVTNTAIGHIVGKIRCGWLGCAAVLGCSTARPCTAGCGSLRQMAALFALRVSGPAACPTATP